MDIDRGASPLGGVPRVGKYTAWMVTMRINAANGIIAMVIPLKLSLLKPSPQSCSISGYKALDWNGASLPITHTGKIFPSPDFHLFDVLVVPHPTKNLLSISKLMSDFPLSITFTNDFFTVRNRQTGRVVATCNNSKLLDSFTCKFNFEFATKDLGSLGYFLGLEATSTTDCLLISQLKYARDILTCAQLLDSKLVHTPMVVSQHLSVDGSLFSNIMLYRSLVGALQYLTITHPDIAHVVNSVSQFLHSLTEDHFLDVKRILHYIKGTLHFGLIFHPSTALGALLAYSDAYWVGCPDTHHSASSYCIYLGNNLVSWNAKKQPTLFRSNTL
ncbi:uncharacterized mitochondrial protein AtMg00810-like [Malania oleifera]|uniref:uncharacterized mitochondrial protein AtMg00810-like n=1 Tax=Malania oleifera TaxID=397392 RepID=UPI0025ADFC8D|nr:uncharacterized mitochondrial protein AtMg00810-like [Malania oleifera]